MTEVTLGVVAGAALGGVYFGGLWVTVRRIPEATRPALLMLGSYVIRLGTLGTGLWGAARLGGAPATIGALLGILAVRQMMVRRLSVEDGVRAADVSS